MNPIKLSEHELITDPKFSNNISNIPFLYFHKVPTDGNCFYSSVSLLIFNKLKIDSEFNLLFFSFKDSFEKIEVSECVYESYIEHINELLENNVEILFNENSLKCFIAYLRLILSTHLKLNKNKYQNFLTENIDNYIFKNIDRMETCAGDIEIKALSDVLKIKIIVYDINGNKLNKITYGDGFTINILHTPNHFEPLFNKI